MISTLEVKNDSLLLKVYTRASPNTKWTLECELPLNLPTNKVLKYDIFVPKQSRNIIIPTIIKNEEEDLLEVHVLAAIKTESSYKLRSTGTTSLVDFDNMTYSDVPENMEFGFVDIAEQ